MAFNGSEGAPIAIDVASTWTATYRNNNPNSVKAMFFGREILENILSQYGCMGIRFYFAINASGENTLIAVGADANENDQTGGTIADFSFPCPPHCGNNSPLNGGDSNTLAG